MIGRGVGQVEWNLEKQGWKRKKAGEVREGDWISYDRHGGTCVAFVQMIEQNGPHSVYLNEHIFDVHEEVLFRKEATPEWVDADMTRYQVVIYNENGDEITYHPGENFKLMVNRYWEKYTD